MAVFKILSMVSRKKITRYTPVIKQRLGLLLASVRETINYVDHGSSQFEGIRKTVTGFSTMTGHLGMWPYSE